MRLCLAAAFLLGAAPAVAHDQWANGKAVPAWIRSACCGSGGRASSPARSGLANARGDYVVEGYHEPLAARFALPSQDGEYWIFYRDNLDGSQSAVFCFFVPMNF